MAVDTSIYNLLDPQVALKAQVADIPGSIQKGVLTRAQFDKAQEMRETKGQRQKLLDQSVKAGELGIKQTEAALQLAEQQGAAKRMINRMENLEGFLHNADIDGALKYLGSESASVTESGGSAANTNQAAATIQQMRAEGMTDGDIAKTLISQNREQRDKIYDSGLVERSELETKRLEEARGRVAKSNEKIDTQVSFLTDTEESLKKLAAQIKSGDRSAVSSFFVKLVKSQDPNSAVLAGEMLAAMNLQDLAETAFSIARGEGNTGELEAAFSAQIAGLSPKNVNIKDALNTADSNLAGKRKALLDTYDINEEAKGRLSRGGRLDLTSSKRDERIKGYREGSQPMWYSFLDDNQITQLNDPKQLEQFMASTGITDPKEAQAAMDNAMAKKVGILGMVK